VRRVLVVDDDGDLLRIMREKLIWAGYEVITADNGREGLDKVVTEKPDLVLLDVMMPELDGLEVCRKIKTNPETKRVKVAIFSVRSSPRDRELSAEYLADAHISKPVSMDMLLKIVGRILEK
jgi:two-component system alkaline phosphatase synthesis response regulator PhoP